MFTVSLHKKAEHFLKRLKDRTIKRRIREAIENLQVNPFPREVVRVEGFQTDKVFLVRIGDYRILYAVRYDQNTVYILKIDKRARVY